MRRTLNRLVTLATVAVIAPLSFGYLGVTAAAQEAEAPPEAPPELPTSLHGAVETQAFTAGNGALALFVDPGTAYAYSTMDRDDYGGGSVSYTMTARGANLNLGVIALAVLWAAPNCEGDGNSSCHLSGGSGGPNTGLHEAAGFPAYAEALYPPPPEEDGPSRERVYKCVVNKDAPGAAPTNGDAGEVCKSSDGVPLSAWAEAPGEEFRSSGFSRAAGFSVPGAISVGGSESRSEVRHIGEGKLGSAGYSTVSDISVADGQIRIAKVRAEGKVISDAEGNAERIATCTFSGMTVGGQPVSPGELESGAAQPLFDAVEQATKIKVEIVPPAPVISEVREGGKQVAECTGIQVKVTDMNPGSPVPVCSPADPPEGVPGCVPALGNRMELTFGKISVQQTVSEVAATDAGGDVLGGLTDLPTSSTDGLATSSVGDTSGTGGGGDFSAGLGSGTDATGGGATDFATPTDSGGGSEATAGGGGTPEVAAGQQGGTSGPGEPVNLALVGSLTAAAGGAILACALLLIGVVNSLATGGPLRIPGLG